MRIVKRRFTKSQAALVETNKGLLYRLPMSKKKPPTAEQAASGRRFERYLRPFLFALNIRTMEELGHLCGRKSKAAVSQWYSSGKIGKTSIAQISKLIMRPEGEILAVLRGHAIDSTQQVFSEIESQEKNVWADVRAFAQGVGLGSGQEADEYAEVHKLKFRHSSLRGKRLIPENLQIWTGTGDSMLPRIKSGDAVLFDKTDTKPVDGALYVVLLGSEYYVKRAEFLDDRVYFKSDNPAGDRKWIKARRMDNPKEPIQVFGRVRWIGSWED